MYSNKVLFIITIVICVSIGKCHHEFIIAFLSFGHFLMHLILIEFTISTKQSISLGNCVFVLRIKNS